MKQKAWLSRISATVADALVDGKCLPADKMKLAEEIIAEELQVRVLIGHDLPPE